MGRYRHWLPWLALLVAALAVASCSGSSNKAQDASGPKANGPRIAVPEESFDFGKVPLNKMVSHAFVIKNVGTENLTLVGQPQVRAVQGCWPPEAVVGATTIKPGGQTTLKIETVMHEGMDGPHLFEISVKTNDPVERDKKITLTGDFGKY